MTTSSGSDERRLLDDIRRLLILQLVRQGATWGEVGRALGVDESRVRQLVGPRSRPPKKGTAAH